MLRVGLTGDLGSGKSTVARMFQELGALLFSSDEMARAMMQPGHPVYRAIVQRFGASVLLPGGLLDRRALAKLAFERGRVEELNSIVHPAVLQEQARLLDNLGEVQPHAIAIVESALLFSTQHGVGGQPWRERFDRIVLVTAPEEKKIARFVARLSAGRPLTPAEQIALEEDARARLALQSGRNDAHAGECLVIENAGSLVSLRIQVEHAWQALRHAEARSA